jgi:hypothetical protein
MRNLRFSKRCWWRFESSVIMYVKWYVGNVSKNRSTLIFRVMPWTAFIVLASEDVGITLFRNVGYYYQSIRLTSYNTWILAVLFSFRKLEGHDWCVTTRRTVSVSVSFLDVPYRLSTRGFRFIDFVSCTSTCYGLGCFIRGLPDVLTDFSCFLSVLDVNTRDMTIILEQATNFLGAFRKIAKSDY